MLREHQAKTVDASSQVIYEHKVVYIAAECRTGKTMMALELARRVSATKVLFVTPKAAIGSILGDFELMGGGEVMGYDLKVINRESLHKIGKKESFSMVICDESHRDGGYPKPSKSAKALKTIPRDFTVLMSGTPSVESASQLFHQFYTTNGRGPWGAYNSFYRWHKDFGVPKKKRIAGGQEVNDYTEVRTEVLDHVRKYSVSMTQSEAGFQHKAEVVAHKVKDHDAVSWCANFEKTQVWQDDVSTVVAETPAALLQKQHMRLGGSMIDDDGQAFTIDPNPKKLEFLLSKLDPSKQYFVSTNYIKEREIVAMELTLNGFLFYNDYEEFKELKGTDKPGVLVGSGVSLAEGVDLSWMTGSMVIYSQNWSGAKWLQLLERQNNFKRDRPIKVNVLIVENSIDEQVFEAVQSKKNFNATVYKKLKC